MSSGEQPIIIKRVKKSGDGHHGGAWKVAYADFVTAMMAFFLLMWLLNVTDVEQKNAISNYFDPSHPKVSVTESGAGGMLGGTTVSPDGAMSSQLQPVVAVQVSQTTTKGHKKGKEGEGHAEQRPEETLKKLEERFRKKEEQKFKEIQKKIMEEIRKSKELAELEKHIKVDITPEGLRIQIVDQHGKSMFPSGSAEMLPDTKELLAMVGQAILPLSNALSVRGHTDGATYPDGATYTNWELSADRANASRRVLLESGLPPSRIANVVGKADTDHINPADPRDPTNRRISIILLREAFSPDKMSAEDDEEESGTEDSESEGEDSSEEGSHEPVEPEPTILPEAPPKYEPTEGEIYFP